MVALISNNKPVLGVVYAPALNKLYYGIKNEGSYLIESGLEKRLVCNIDKEIDEFDMVTSIYNFTEQDKITSKKIKITNFKPLGSIGIKLGEIGNQYADIYLNLDGLNQWDLAPGQIILEEAGGACFDKFGNEFKYLSNVKRFTSGVIAISNKSKKEELVNFIK